MMTQPSLNSLHVAIIGMGLMGASLGYDLRGRVRRVTGVVRRPEAVAATEASGCVDEATVDARAAAAEADLVVLATPVRTILRQIEELGPLMQPGAVLIDMGSTKTAICRAMAALPEHVQPVGGHPMCGKEVAGLEAAEPGLYRGCTFVLCPLPRTASQALELAQALVAHIHARPLILDPERHDQLVAAISHLPYLSASALVAHVMSVAEEDERVWEVAASGFRDASRVAASDVRMMLDILLTNSSAVMNALDDFADQIAGLRRALAAGDEALLTRQLEAIARARRNWGKNRQTH
ncbi:MAG TPA: prephenate dehydrogenase [Anaerolineae bacterium]|nr:prephenate dehydrogenase [Caldilineae bacterium]HID33742.1 prephenate dehydrogenase [Anaerolineae bacterium]HIQ12589.1 prephenate dehydrogenase [Caldilineales bacterium]